MTSQVLGPGPAVDVSRRGDRRPSEPNGEAQGSLWEWGEGLFLDPATNAWHDGSDYAARDMNDGIRTDEVLKVLEFAMTEPIRSATWKLKPRKDDRGQAVEIEEQLRRKRWDGGMQTPIGQVVGQMTTAVYHKRSYHAKALMEDPRRTDNTVMWRELSYRPATTSRLLRDPVTGKMLGFEQDLSLYAQLNTQPVDGKPIPFPLRKALIHVHGAHRDPVGGVSDLEVAYWCWKTKQKLVFLWMRFLEGVALPRTIVGHQGDEEKAKAAARQIASMGSSGVAWIDKNNMDLDTLDLSGNGPSPFTDAIRYFRVAACVSVRATFVELGTAAAGTSQGARGSNGMFSGMVEDFMSGRQAVADEMAETLTEQVVAPISLYNFGPGGCPDWVFDPLAGVDKQPIMDLLKLVAATPQTALPPEFVSELIMEAARILQLDEDKIRSAVEKAQKAAEQQAQQAGADPLGQQVSGVHAAVDKISKITASVQKARAKGQQQ